MPFAPKTRQTNRRKESRHRHGTASERGYGWQWHKARTDWLTQFIAETGNPYCRICNSAPATCVDHITPPSSVGTPDSEEYKRLFWDVSNWQPACVACNSRKGGKEGKVEGGRVTATARSP